MNKIKLIIKEELLSESKRYILESFKSISNGDDINIVLESFLNVKNKLISEGYNNNEIDTVLEQNDFLSNIAGNLEQGITGGISNLYNKTNVGKTLTDAGLNMVKDQIVFYLLTTLGVNKKLASLFMPLFGELDPKILLQPFKSEQACVTYSPQISDKIMKGVIYYMQSGEQGLGTLGEAVAWDNVAKVGVTNVLGELITQSNIGELISSKLCKTIWENGNN